LSRRCHISCHYYLSSFSPTCHAILKRIAYI
jgi:hypothetical protein